jgi:hypothetical protein
MDEHPNLKPAELIRALRKRVQINVGDVAIRNRLATGWPLKNY